MEVPSGSIYKHLFEAQSQLADSLTKSRSKKATRDAIKEEAKKERTSIKPKKTDLNQYDSDEEDYRANDVDDVRGLDDSIAGADSDIFEKSEQNPEQNPGQHSTITSRLSEKRLLKHSAELAKLDQKLAIVKNSTESSLSITLQKMNNEIKEKVAMSKAILKPMEQEAEENILYQRTKESLEDQWSAVKGIFKELKTDVERLTSKISEIEADRTKKLTNILSESRQDLQKIAFLAEADVIRLIAELITETNKSLMMNRGHFSDVIARLSRHIVSEQLNSHVFYQKYSLIWKNQYIQNSIERFKEFINSEEISNPPDQVGSFKDLQVYYEKSWAVWRESNFSQILGSFAPPNSTRMNASEMLEQFEKLREELNSKNMEFLQGSVRAFRESEKKRSAQIESFKDELIEDQVTSFEEATLVVNEKFLVLSQEISGTHANDIQTMSIVMEDASIRFKNQIDTIRRLMLALARIWDGHRDKSDRFHELMDKEFLKHKENFEHQRGIRENTLENLIKKLSQQTTEDQLTSGMTVIENTINGIMTAFNDYQKVQADKLALFGPKINKEASSYVEEVERFFGQLEEFFKEPNMIESCNDEALQLFEAVKSIETKLVDDNAELDSRMSSIRSSLNLTAEPGSRPVTANSQQNSRTNSQNLLNKSSLHIDQLMNEAKPSKPTRTNLLQPNLVDADVPVYVKSLVLLDSDITAHIDSIKDLFSKHITDYSKVAKEQFKSISEQKISRMQDEINLELQLYKHRPVEIRESVYDTRKSEVDEHRVRTSRHLRAINENMEGIKTQFIDLEQDLLEGQGGYLTWIKQQEPVFASRTKSDELVKLLDVIRNNMYNQKESIQLKTQEKTEGFQEISESIKQANFKIIETFKSFEEGGNFSNDEVTSLTRRIEKANTKVQQPESKFEFELDELKAKLVDQAMDTALRAEDKLKHHLIDVVFIEQCQRWLTNTQVKIRGVVAKCNSQASEIRVATDALRQAVVPDHSQNPEDNLVIIREQFVTVMNMLQARTDLLSCRMSSGKTINELASIKNSVSLDVLGVTSGASNAAIHGNDLKSPHATPRESMINQSRDSLSATESEQFIRKTKTSVKNQSKKRGQPRICPPSYLEADESKENCSIPKQPPLFQHQVLTALGVVTVRRREVKFDIKYLLFGAFQPELTTDVDTFKSINQVDTLPGTSFLSGNSFLEDIHRVLWDGLDGLLSTTESYYKTRGHRPITRPTDIKETFDKSAESICTRMNSYDRQTRNFHKSSLDEFHKQLDVCEQLMQQLPEYFFKVLINRTSYELVAEIREIYEQVFKIKWHELETLEKYKIKERLRPDLGHPANVEKLEDLLQEENRRVEKVVTLVHEVHRQSMYVLEQRQVEFF
jgi:hypothetical protein